MKLHVTVAWCCMLSIGLGANAQDRKTHYKTALDGTFAPHAMPRLDGGIEGFNVDLINALANELDVKISIDAVQFSGLIPALQAKTYDFLAAPVEVSPELSETLLFTEGYMEQGFRFVVRSDAPAYSSLGDFAGKTIAANKGSGAQKFLEDNKGKYGWSVTTYGTSVDSIAAVLTKRADAVVIGMTPAAWAVKKNPQLKQSILQPTGWVWGIPFRRNDQATRNLFDGALECLKVKGVLAALYEKWLGQTPPAGSLARTPTPGYGVPGFEGYDATAHELRCKP